MNTSPSVQSTPVRINRFTDDQIVTALETTKIVSVCGFCHNIRVNKKMIFIVLRKQTETIQLIVFKNEQPEAFDMIKDLFDEATIDVIGEIVPAKIKTCAVKNYEIKISSVNIINRSRELPFSLDNANESFQLISDLPEDEESTLTLSRSRVSRPIRLDNRWLDLRTPINQNIFKLRSAFEHSIRSALIGDGFVSIATPKIIPAISEGTASVFDVNYFGKTVYLAQSPQLYKQMMINGGFDKVFEIGPVFRAETANTYRHLCEFTGLDMEFAINPDQSHLDIIDTIWKIIYTSYTDFDTNNHDMISYVLDHTKAERLVFPEKPVMIDFREGCEMLKEIGILQDPLDDIGSVNEKILGDLVKQKFNTDVYVLVGFPNKARPFYTMHQDQNYSRSFDFMMRGNEIASGAQRVHDPIVLRQAVTDKGIILDDINKTSGLEDYVRSFETGSVPHGGAGFGLERLVMLILGLTNVRTTTLFPRDPKRTTP